MKADQERVKNLLIDTVTLLCKNSLTYKDELCIEGLLGVKVDHKDVFFVHISETFESVVPKLNSPTSGQQQPKQGNDARNDHDSVPRKSTPHPGTPVHVKQETRTEADDDAEILEESPSLMKPESIGAQPAHMIAGQRRVVRRHAETRSSTQAGITSDGSSRAGGFQDSSYSEYSVMGGNGDTDTGEPLAKRPYKLETEDDSFQSEEGHSDVGNNPWPNIAHIGEMAAQMAQSTFQGGQNTMSQGGEMMQPGCSTWPVATGLMGSGPTRGPSEMGGTRALHREGPAANTGFAPVRMRAPQTQSDARRRHHCQVCGKGFGAPALLKRHMRTHTGERPFTCDICGMRFSQNEHRQRHIKKCHTAMLFKNV